MLQLQPSQADVLASLGPYHSDSRKLINCRPHSRCGSIYCPTCTQLAGYRRKDRLFAAVGQDDPSRKWKLLTFTSANVPIQELRSATQTITKAIGKTMKRLKIADYAHTSETSFRDWSEDAHPHSHMLVSPPNGGRNFVSEDGWRNAWLTALPAELHPSQEAIHQKAIERLEQAAFYLCKSPFTLKLNQSSKAITGRILAGISATKGLGKLHLRGRLALAA